MPKPNRTEKPPSMIGGLSNILAGGLAMLSAACTLGLDIAKALLLAVTGAAILVVSGMMREQALAQQSKELSRQLLVLSRKIDALPQRAAPADRRSEEDQAIALTKED